MLVKDLIKELKKFPQDMEACTGGMAIGEVKIVETDNPWLSENPSKLIKVVAIE